MIPPLDRSPALAALALLLSGGCASRAYTHYLIEPAPAVDSTFEEDEGTRLRPFAFGSTTSMKVSWNDGDVITEVQIPMLAGGQRILIEHTRDVPDVDTLPATRLVPPPPTPADATLEEAYRERGLRVNPEAAAVSLTGARARMDEALEQGNPALGLQWAELILARYPSHPETLRAKASILLLLGEREKAIETYEAAEEIASDPAVRETLERLLDETP
jgi:hypothetical protein